MWELLGLLAGVVVLFWLLVRQGRQLERAKHTAKEAAKAEETARTILDYADERVRIQREAYEQKQTYESLDPSERAAFVERLLRDDPGSGDDPEAREAA